MTNLDPKHDETVRALVNDWFVNPKPSSESIQDTADRLIASITRLVEQRVAQTAAEILLIIKGSRMVGQSPIGRLHQIGWNEAVSLISDRARAIIADPNWLSKRDVERAHAARLDEAKW